MLQHAAAAFYALPEVTTPLLKLYAELVYNKAQRLTFDSSSPNGILLFRDASAILVAYGSRIKDEQLAPGVDPSGHARVCANTLVYVAWLLPAASHAPWRLGAALAWALAQLATLFVSGW